MPSTPNHPRAARRSSVDGTERRTGGSQRGAGKQFDHPRREEIERPRRPVLRHPDRDDQRRRGDHQDRRQQQPAVLTRPTREADEQQRPQQVELLLDGKRPVVQQRRWLGLGELRREVVAEAPGEHEVDDEHPRRHGVDGQRALGQRRQARGSPPISVTTSTRHDAGSSRRARRAQNPGSDNVPVDASSLSSKRVIRNPDRTKNTSTPTNPPWKAPSRRWNSTTATTANARSPSTSGRNSSSATPWSCCPNGAPPGDVGRARDRADGPARAPDVDADGDRGRTKPTSRGRADLDRPPRHPPRLVAAVNAPGGPRPTLHLGKIRVNRRSGEDSSQGPRRTFPRTWARAVRQAERCRPSGSCCMP